MRESSGQIVRQPRARRATMATLAAAALALAGCGGGDASGNPFGMTAPCPRVGIIADAADLSRYAGGSQDLSALVLDARIAGFSARCDYASRGGGLNVELTVTLDIERGPAAQSRNAEVTYLVAVVDTNGETILQRQAFPVRVTFPSNVTRVRDDGEKLTIRMPGNTSASAARQVLIGLQLTEAELALNRRRGAR
ncbi:hypothetical protein ACQW02_10970 [Humitalea sp. 24SJ18S-53]|uniref:hypothetical protein n=1 Tax=Humitalea sp. 24SJ18S-53 TaxID=3422307 RepID=UPI003D67DC9B